MIKKLLIGASALAFATAANAQTPPQFNGTISSVTDYNVPNKDYRINGTIFNGANGVAESAVKTNNNPDSTARKASTSGAVGTGPSFVADGSGQPAAAEVV